MIGKICPVLISFCNIRDLSSGRREARIFLGKYFMADVSGLRDLQFFAGRDLRYTVTALLSQALLLPGTDTPKETLPRPLRSGSGRYLQGFPGILVSFAASQIIPKLRGLK